MKKLLIIILIIAAALRFVGIYPGYNQFHPDEGMSYSTAASIIKEDNLYPRDGYRVRLAYPYLVPLISVFAFKYFFVPIGWATYFINHLGEIIDGLINFPLTKVEEQRIFQLDVLGVREINTIFWTRSITALFGIGNVLLVYLIGSKFLNKKVGLIAAFILTFDFRQVTNSHFGLPDIYNSFFLLLAILTSMELLEHPIKKNYLIAGIVAGLAFNVKFQFFGFVPLAISHLLVVIGHRKEWIKTLFSTNFLACFLFIPLLTLLINPFHFIHIEDALVQITDVALKYGVGTNLLNFFPIWYLYTAYMGVLLLAISILGVFFGLLTNFKKSAVIVSVLALQSFFFLYYSTGGFHVRNLIPLTPFLILFAALILERVARVIPIYLFVPILMLIVFVPAKNSLISDYYYTKPWNFNLLSEWLYKNPLDGSVASNPTDPPTGTPPIDRTEFVQGASFSMAEHIENGAKYAIINTDWVGNSFYWWMVYYPGTFREKLNKPIAKLRDSYYGLATEELLRYQIFAATKPWQAPEANLILVQFPVWSTTEMTRIMLKNGEVLKQVGLGKSYLESFETKSSHLYKFEFLIASDRILTPGNRDGFVRVDFNGGSCVSARLFGRLSAKRQLYCLAPASGGPMTIGLQAENTGSTIWIEDLSIWESRGTINTVPGLYPYINNNVQLELIYQNSQANL